MKTSILATTLVIIQLANVAMAQEAVTLEEGEPAPFTGTLLTPEAVARILAQQEEQEQICQEEIRYQLERQEELYNLRFSAYDERIEFLELALDEARSTRDETLNALDIAVSSRNNSIFRSPAFGFIAGTVFGGAIVVAAVKAVEN